MKQEKGFVLAFSLLISSIVLALAFGIFNILLKQIVLTSTAANSQVSFYAADAGAECALYWDTHNSRTKASHLNAFDTNDNYLYDYRGAFALGSEYPDMNIIAPNTYSHQVNIVCGENTVSKPITLTVENGISATSTFTFSQDNFCAKVSVNKNFNDPDDRYDTKIESLGYNVPCADINTGGKKVVERAIRVQY